MTEFTPPATTLPEWAKGIKLVSGAGSSGDDTCCVMSLAPRWTLEGIARAAANMPRQPRAAGPGGMRRAA